MSDLSQECAPKRTSVDHSDFMGSRPKRAAKDNHRPGRAPGFLFRDRANGRCDACSRFSRAMPERSGEGPKSAVPPTLRLAREHKNSREKSRPMRR